MVITNNSINKVASTVLILLAIVLSFFVGTTQSKPVKIDNTKSEEEIKSLKGVISEIKKDKTHFNDIGLYVPSLEEAPNCIDQFPIKVKMDKGDNKYYTSTNKVYPKVKADLCLKNQSMLIYLTNIRPG